MMHMRDICSHMTLKEAALQLEITVKSVRRLVEDGDLRAYTVSPRGSLKPRFRTDQADIDAFKANGGTTLVASAPAPAPSKPVPRKRVVKKSRPATKNPLTAWMDD